MARLGVKMSRQAMCGYLGGLAPVLAPFAEAIGNHVRSGEVFHIDDTPCRCSIRAAARRARAGLSAWSETKNAGAAMRRRRSSTRMHPTRAGTRSARCSTARAAICTPMPTLGSPAFMPRRSTTDRGWSRLHVGRTRGDGFTRRGDLAARRAERVLGWMKELFALEKEVRAMPLGVRLAARRERALPTIENMKLFLDWARAAGSSVMPIAPAVNYVLDRWDSFLRYTTDRRLEMTSNAAERSIKPCVLGRKNYLFQGSDAGGVRSAIFYTIVETCSANRIDPEDYLADVIVRIGTHPNKRIDELLPWRWAEARRRAA